MATLREVSRPLRQLPFSQLIRPAAPFCVRRCASTQAAATPASKVPDLADLEADSSLLTPELGQDVKATTPRIRAMKRKTKLPGSRYQYHPPKYERGPLHPIQSPASSDPVARDFVPGPYNLPRLKQTYQSTIASDIMTLTYTHKPPGTVERETPERLRGWDGSSPYHKNRARRGPRGSAVLRPIEKDIDFRNIPEIKSVTVVSHVPKAVKDPDHLIVARAMMQAITGSVPEITKVKTSVVQWGMQSGKQAGVKATIHGNAAYEFVDKCIHLVFPKIKDWKGIKGSTGDSSGNLAWGFEPEDMAHFPEMEANYSMYPPKMVPGCRVFVETTARSDRHARLLFQAMGIPFYGELRD